MGPVGSAARPQGHHDTITRWGIGIAVLGAVVAGVVTLVVVAGGMRARDVAPPPGQAALRDWWTTAEPAVTDLQAALYESQSALRRFDSRALTGACQRMHDAAAVDVPAQLPAPDRHLTAELDAAAEDAHSAAHMCLAVLDKSPNNYEGEFNSGLDQAEQQLRAVMVDVNRILTGHPPTQSATP